MTDKVFIDTNVLVYAYDRSELTKQPQALIVLDHLALTKTGVITPQIMAEFFVTVTRKITPPLTPEEAYQRLLNYWQVFTVVDLTGLITLEAVRGVRDYQFSFWDAQIWAAARLNQISIVFSEDFSPGTMIEGIRFVNPFAETFQLEEWA